MKIKYLKHPVTAEEKQKHISQGFKIMDIRFKPAPKKKPKTVKETVEGQS